MHTKLLSVLIVDDNPFFVQRMATLLDELDCVSSIHTAGNFEEAFVHIHQHHPDMVLLDINLPGKNGIALLKEIRANCFPCKVIMISNNTAEYYRDQCQRLGAMRFLDKTADFDLVPFIINEMTA